MGTVKYVAWILLLYYYISKLDITFVIKCIYIIYNYILNVSRIENIIYDILFLYVWYFIYMSLWLIILIRWGRLINCNVNNCIWVELLIWCINIQMVSLFNIGKSYVFHMTGKPINISILECGSTWCKRYINLFLWPYLLFYIHIIMIIIKIY